MADSPQVEGGMRRSRWQSRWPASAGLSGSTMTAVRIGYLRRPKAGERALLYAERQYGDFEVFRFHY
jgi:hypothetical protein